MIIKCGLKIDLIMSEPQYVKFLSMSLLHSTAVRLFDIWQIIGNSLNYFSDLFHYLLFIFAPSLKHQKYIEIIKFLLYDQILRLCRYLLAS